MNVDNTKGIPTILSLCTGYGGIEIGLDRIFGGIAVLAHVEIEAFAVANLVNKMEAGQMVPAPIWTDVKTFDAKPFRSCVDILTGGYPCQPFSAAGNRGGEDDPRHLWPYIRTIVMDCRPGQVFFENVEGHLSLGISEVLEDLESMGYRIAVGIFSAVEVGAPHQRKRVFILADSGLQRQKVGELPTEGTVKRGKKLADSNERSGKTGGKFARREKGAASNKCGSEELGDSQSNNKRRLSVPTMHREGIKTGRSSCNQWPARPGAPQHEWEEPRVLADSNGPRAQTNRGNNGVGRVEQCAQDREKSHEEIKPKLGRTIDGSRNRVDRLRLLGNGVVPKVAEKAYLTLSDKLKCKEP